MMNQAAAKFRMRLLASFLDVTILVLICGLGYFLLYGEYSTTWTEGWLWQLLYTLYLTVTPVIWGGYIIGKRICKIRIKRFTDNEPVKITNMILREVLGYYVLGLITFGLSIIASVFMVAFRKDKRALHDIIGGTYVAKQ